MALKLTSRNGYPNDLRTDGPSGEVKVYWQPEAFTWHGEEARSRGGKDEVFVSLAKTQFRISSKAAKEANLKAGDRVQIGVNKQFLAIKKSKTGLPIRSDRGKPTTYGLCVSATKLIKQLADEGWPVPGRLNAVFDDTSGMLVAKKPQGATSA